MELSRKSHPTPYSIQGEQSLNFSKKKTSEIQVSQISFVQARFPAMT